MVQCSTGTSSHQPCNLLTNHRGHDLGLDLKGLAHTVLTRQRLGHQSRANRPSVYPH